MAATGVGVMTAQQFFQKFAEQGIGKGADKWLIRRQLIDAFRKEIFDLTAERTHGKDPDEMRRVTKAIIHDETFKWRKVCDMFARYKETKDLIRYDDLKEIMKD